MGKVVKLEDVSIDPVLSVKQHDILCAQSMQISRETLIYFTQFISLYCHALNL